MDEEPSTSGGIKRHIPLELQNEIDELALKHPREAAIQDALDDNTKRWLVVGICLHSVISPALRKYVDSILTVFHNELISFYKINVQIYPGHLKRDPHSGFFLNYEAVNNNKANYGRNIAKYDYTIKDAVDLSKLFLQTHMAQYTGFDENCDSSALLGLILNIAKFDPIIKSDADDVRTIIRNPWAHCNFTAWDAAKFSNSFQLMKKLVKDLKLSLNEEKLIFDELEKGEINGQRFLSGTTHGLELFRKLRRATHALAKYATSVATETDDDLKRIKKELMKFEIIFNQMADLERDMKNRFSEVDKKLLTQDKTAKKHSTQIGELKEEMNKCACRDLHKVDIESWKEQELMFVVTPVVKTISQIIESKQSVLIVGEPGIGKSMLLHNIALQQHRKNEYSIIPCSEIQDICCHFRKDTRQMFVIDDICGRFTVSVRDIEYLLKNEDSFKLMLKNGMSKIAATCRLDIYNDEQFHASCSLFALNIFNLSEEYSKQDKLMISSKYLNEINIQLLKDQNEPFTPLMCYLYSKNEDFNLTDFFHCPYESYRNEWDKVKSIDPYKYCALFMCVIYNGTIKESLFDIFNENINTNHKVIFDICGINQGTSLNKMKNVFDQIIGTYLKKTKDEYKVIHDHMFDFMCYYFGNKDILVRSLLRYAHIEVLNERTQLESINEQHGKFSIIILRKNEQDYFKRMKTDLQHGNLSQWFRSVQMKHEKYRVLFLNELKSKDNDFFIDYNTLQESVIISSFYGYYDIVYYFISKDVDLDKGYAHITPLTAACKGGHYKLVQLLINKGCDVNHGCEIGETPLIAACSIGNKKLVRFLIDKGCDVNQTGMRQTPLTAAIYSKNEKVVKLLIDKGSDVNKIHRMIDTPLVFACRSGHENIVQVLIEKGSDVHQMNGLEPTPLEAAFAGGFEKVAQILIDKGSDVNKVDFIGQTHLTTACNDSNEKIAQFLIANGADVNQVGDKGRTPLTAACNKGNENIVQLLISKGVDVNQVDRMKASNLTTRKKPSERLADILNNKEVKGQSPLTTASKKNNEKIIQLLINAGADVNQSDGIGQTSLTTACKEGNEKIAKFIIDKGGDVNQVNGMKETPLTAACTSGNENLVQILLDKIDNVTNIDGMRETPLTAACFGKNENIVQLLIDKACDVNQVDGMKETPLNVACMTENEKIVQLLINKGCDVNRVHGMESAPLITACRNGNEKIVQVLVDKGCDVNTVDDSGETSLIPVCKLGNLTITELLINRGCDVNRANGFGQTPLLAACEEGNENIVRLLIDKVSNVDHDTAKRRTPLTAACWKGSDKIVQLLIEKGCDFNQVDGMRETPLTTVCKAGNKQIVQLLLDKGCDVNQFGGMRETPLTLACKKENKQIVELLLDKGCDVNQFGGMGETPLTLACKAENKQIVELILDKGCDVNQFGGMRETPLTLACRAGNEKIVQLLIDKGGDVNKVNGRGESPLTTARSMRNHTISQLLIQSRQKGNCIILSYLTHYCEIL